MAANALPKYLIGTWGSDKRPVPATCDTDIARMIANNYCDFLIGGDRPAYIVICTIDVSTREDSVTIVGGCDAYMFPRMCPITCAWINRCNTRYAGKQYVIYNCWMGQDYPNVGNKMRHMAEQMHYYEAFVDEITHFLELAKPRTMFVGRVGSQLELTVTSTIDCYTACDKPIVSVISKPYDDGNGGTIVYNARMYASKIRDVQSLIDTRTIDWRTGRDTADICNMYKWLLDKVPDAIVYINVYVSINNNSYQPSVRPCGPLLQAFAGILTAEQIALHGSGRPSDEPTYDADDAASDDDYGSDPEIIDYNDDYDLGEYDLGEDDHD